MFAKVPYISRVPNQPLRLGGALALSCVACALVAGACSGFTSSSSELRVDDSGVSFVDGADDPAADAPIAIADSGVDSGPAYDAGAIVRDSNGCPTGRGPKMVISDGRCVDESEVTEAQFDVAAAANLNDIPRAGFCETSKSMRPTNTRDFPVTNVSWCDAFAFCAWSGKRLCTDVDRASAVCFEHPVQPYSGCNLATNKGPQAVKTHCKNNAGVYDAVGNVQEFMDVGKPVLTDIASWGGGNSYTTSYGPNVCTDPYTVYLPFDGHVTSKDANLGFRCCADPLK